MGSDQGDKRVLHHIVIFRRGFIRKVGEVTREMPTALSFYGPPQHEDADPGERERSALVRGDVEPPTGSSRVQ